MTDYWAWEESSDSESNPRKVSSKENAARPSAGSVSSGTEFEDEVANSVSELFSFKQKAAPPLTLKRPPSLFEISIGSDFVAKEVNRSTPLPIDENMAAELEVDWDETEWEKARDKRASQILDDLLLAMKNRFLALVAEGALPQISPEEIEQTTSDRAQLIQILRTNRTLCTQQLQRRLFAKSRPTQDQIEERGIVVPGYFSSHDKALEVKRKRRMSTAGDMENMLRMRPKPEELVEKGLVPEAAIQHMVEAPSEDGGDGGGGDRAHDVSILRSLLFLTIQEALKQSCLDCHQSEQQILTEMEQITQSLKRLRDDLDQYDASNILQFEKEEERVRDQFRVLQTQLLRIGERQKQIHGKLTILHGVERDLVALQNEYDKKLNGMRRKEEGLLHVIKQMRAQKGRAMKIMYAERSHQNWAMAKLNYTISVAEQHTELSKRKMERDSEEKSFEEEYQSDVTFTDDLSEFLTALKELYQQQNAIVLLHEEQLEHYESDLQSVQHMMTMTRRATFKKIYDLHREVEVADMLDLGIRRVSVATATEIERERRHHSTKIQRQLATLHSQLQQINVEVFASKMNEIVDVQSVMSDSNMKLFFTVFVQVFCQYFIDIDLLWEQLQATEVLEPKTLSFFEGTEGVKMLAEFRCSEESADELSERTSKVHRVLRILKGAIRDEDNQLTLQFARKMGIDLSEDVLQFTSRIETNQIDSVAVFVARKLATNDEMMSQIVTCDGSEVPMLAERRCRDVFAAVCEDRALFKVHPHTVREAASAILSAVWSIDVLKEE